MKIFDQIDQEGLDRRELHLWVLALAVILVQAIGVALLMYPTVHSHPVDLAGFPAHAAFFGFCGLSVLATGYFVDRQGVIRRLRLELENEKHQVVQVRQEGSANLLTTLPGLNIFRDQLAMEYRRAANTQQPLSLLTVELKPSSDLTGPGEIEATFGEAAKALMSRLRSEDSIFSLTPGVFGIVLPAVTASGAYRVRCRLMEGLRDVAGASERFSYGVNVVNFPKNVATAREMEGSLQRILPHNASKD